MDTQCVEVASRLNIFLYLRFPVGVRLPGVHHVRGEGVPGGPGRRRLPGALDAGGGARPEPPQVLPHGDGQLKPGLLQALPRGHSPQVQVTIFVEWSALGWEFIKGNKKVRKQDLDQESYQE